MFAKFRMMPIRSGDDAEFNFANPLVWCGMDCAVGDKRKCSGLMCAQREVCMCVCVNNVWCKDD